MGPRDVIPRFTLNRYKHGRELLIDARWIDGWRGIRAGTAAHALAFHELLVVAEGRARIELDLQSLVVDGPAMLVTRADQVRHVDTDRPLALHLVVFTEDARRRATTLGGAPVLRPGAYRDAAQVAAASAVADAMAKEIAGGRLDADRMLDLQLAQLLIVLSRGQATPAPRRPAILDRLDALIDERFRIEHRASFYAGALGVSGDHLSAVVRAHGGGSVKALVQRRVVLEAQRLLLHTRQDIAAIAFALGFDDPAHFTRVFRRTTGHAPSAFRSIAEMSH